MEKLKNIKKRDGQVVHFDSQKIRLAISKAFLAQNIVNDMISQQLAQGITNVLEMRFNSESKVPSVEDVQDIVELVLLSQGFHDIARGYMVYREQHKKLREEKTLQDIKASKLFVINKEGGKDIFDPERISAKLTKIAFGLDHVSVKEIVDETCKMIYNNIPSSEIDTMILNNIRSKIEEHYNYSYFCSRFVLSKLYEDILSAPIYANNIDVLYQHKFTHYVEKGIEQGHLNPKFREFNLQVLSSAITSSRDLLFMYLGMQTIEDRYLLRTKDSAKKAFELPQWLWMRVAMGLALKEENREEKAIEFYNALSEMYLMSSTPTLFNSGTLHSQMSSCYINVAEDHMEGIFKNYSDCALMSKWAGGIGTDWTKIRSKGAKIRGTNGESQGVIPFIKIYNDTALAVNQGGKRKGAFAAYLEVWHGDIYEFLELKKNTGDERRRAHDIHTSVYICDLFMKRVKEKGTWTLFSPDKVPDLNDLCGSPFEERYKWYEKQTVEGSKIVDAQELWRKILTMLFETGHPWITFKDTINVRSPQRHVGVVHSSNLCTEITLNTSPKETAVCNLASINLARMIKNKQLDEELIEKTVRTAMRMLDNVIDNNFYPIPEAEYSNLQHRPVGLGVMGYQDALYQLEIDFDSAENLAFSDRSMEMVSYYAILASSLLAKERGVYKSYKGSKWEQAIFPLDTLDILEQERGTKVLVNRDKHMDWTKVKEHVRQHGMRNSNTMAIAPTATIANITGVVNCIEPIFKNIYMKENLSGNFLVVNKYLIDELDKLGLWNKEILTKIKLDNGTIANIQEIPHSLKGRFKEAFEIDARWVVEAASRRSKWIDQSASTNIFVSASSGKAISDLYMLVWDYGIKTTYYLRTLAASQVTKAIATEAQVLHEQVKLEVPPVPENALLLAAAEARNSGLLQQTVSDQEEKYNVCESCQ